MDIRIKNGIVRGMHEYGCYAFKGIPFAKPPKNKHRFLPPEPCDDWFGAMDCTRYAPRPIQLPPPWCLDKDSFVYSENCLQLNVWTPSADEKKRPVMFNIFGGGHMEGSNSESGSEGYRLAKNHDVVFVAPNYRVGAVGYLYLEHLLGEKYAASGNLGLLDLILALKWVRENISAFGGDPDNVTIVGQSAGGKCVADLLVAPDAAGLFHKAVAMSGALQSIKDIETEKMLTKNFLSAMDLTEKDAVKLLTCSAEEIINGQEIANKVYFKAESYGATADGITIPLNFEENLVSGNYNKVPLMMGHTKEELFPYPNSSAPPMSEEEVKTKFKWKFGNNWKIPFKYYQKQLGYNSPEIAYGMAATRFTYTEAYMKCAKYFSKHMPVWLYRWDFQGGLAANHSSDNEALFSRTNPEKQKLEPQACKEVDFVFQQAVMQFVKCSNPNNENIPNWEPYSNENPVRMLFDSPSATEEFEIVQEEAFPLQTLTL